MQSNNFWEDSLFHAMQKLEKMFVTTAKMPIWNSHERGTLLYTKECHWCLHVNSLKNR